MKQTLVYTIIFAVEVDDSLTTDCDAIEHLRGYGMAEVLRVRVVDKPFDKVTVADADVSMPKGAAK